MGTVDLETRVDTRESRGQDDATASSPTHRAEDDGHDRDLGGLMEHVLRDRALEYIGQTSKPREPIGKGGASGETRQEDGEGWGMAAEGRRVSPSECGKPGLCHDRPEPDCARYHLGCDRKPRVCGRVQYRRRESGKPPWVDPLADACLTLIAIVLAGFALGCIAYVGILLFVMPTTE